jgi:hypothetical protein
MKQPIYNGTNEDECEYYDVVQGEIEYNKMNKLKEKLKCQISNFLYDITNDEYYSDEVILSDEDISKLTDRIVFRNTELREILNNESNKNKIF